MNILQFYVIVIVRAFIPDLTTGEAEGPSRSGYSCGVRTIITGKEKTSCSSLILSYRRANARDAGPVFCKASST